MICFTLHNMRGSERVADAKIAEKTEAGGGEIT